MAKRSQMVNLVTSLQGQRVDFDGAWGSQCQDIIEYALNQLGYSRQGGNAIDQLNIAAAKGWPVQYDAVGVNPKAGDIVVWASDYHEFGHVGICVVDSDGYTITSIEQNVDGNADSLTNGGPTRLVTRGFHQDGLHVIGWFAPPYEEESTPTQPAPQAPADGYQYDEDATMRVTVDKLNVRATPSLSGEIVAYYKAGNEFHYDSVYKGDGYWWVSYIGASGNRRYVACRDSAGTPYGEFF